jgi:hypothetical protein
MREGGLTIMKKIIQNDDERESNSLILVISESGRWKPTPVMSEADSGVGFLNIE